MWKLVPSVDPAVAEKELLQAAVELLRYLQQRYEAKLADEAAEEAGPRWYPTKPQRSGSWLLKSRLEALKKNARYDHIMISGEQLIALGLDNRIDELMKRTFVVPTSADCPFLDVDRSKPAKARLALKQSTFVINVERLVVFYFSHPDAVYWVKDDSDDPGAA